MKYCPYSIIAVLLNELAEQSSLNAGRDLVYLRSRLEHEGISFLTITLPSFAQGIERCIEQGYASRSFFPAFTSKKTECLPKFLSGFTKRVFDKSGVLLEDACPDAVYAIRQVCNFFKKSLIECSDARSKASIKKYASTDEELTRYEDNCKTPDSYVSGVASIVVNRLFGGYERSSAKLRHGSGATAERLMRNERITVSEWPIRCEPYFPYSWHCLPNAGWLNFESGKRYLSESEEAPVRVVLVPKTLKTPRVIAVEPSYMQHMQQGLMAFLVNTMERHPLTRSSIHFTNQDYNVSGAQRASINGRRATLDLSEASDRVSNDLVESIFGASLLGKSLQACRSKKALLPDGTILQLRKFASMGSATCFPVEALVFYVLIQAAVHEMTGSIPSEGSIRMFSKSILVYGDDLIVPVEWLSHVIERLETYGLKVNRDKSFSKSKFRESCGGDFFKGISVKPVYFRIDPRGLDHARLGIDKLLSLSSTANQLYDAGLWKTCSILRSIVEKNCKFPVPIRSYEAAGLYFKSAFQSRYNHWNTKLQRWESLTFVGEPQYRSDPVKNDIGSMLLALRSIGNDEPANFEESVRPYALRRKRRWVA